MSATQAFAGEVISLFGLAFVNGVEVKFGGVMANPASSSAGVIEVIVPKQTATAVDITVTTGAGQSERHRIQVYPRYPWGLLYQAVVPDHDAR